jgi:hypothetical protein
LARALYELNMRTAPAAAEKTKPFNFIVITLEFITLRYRA